MQWCQGALWGSWYFCPGSEEAAPPLQRAHSQRRERQRVSLDQEKASLHPWPQEPSVSWPAWGFMRLSCGGGKGRGLGTVLGLVNTVSQSEEVTAWEFYRCLSDSKAKTSLIFHFSVFTPNPAFGSWSDPLRCPPELGPWPFSYFLSSLNYQLIPPWWYFSLA